MNKIKIVINYGTMALVMLFVQPIFSNQIQDVTNATEFDQLLKNNEVVVAEFYSPTCQHCKDFEKAGIFKALALELPNVQFVKISSVEGLPLHGQYKINGFPTFIYFKNGQQTGKEEGFKQKVPFKKTILERTK